MNGYQRVPGQYNWKGKLGSVTTAAPTSCIVAGMRNSIGCYALFGACHGVDRDYMQQTCMQAWGHCVYDRQPFLLLFNGTGGPEVLGSA